MSKEVYTVKEGWVLKRGLFSLLVANFLWWPKSIKEEQPLWEADLIWHMTEIFIFLNMLQQKR